MNFQKTVTQWDKTKGFGFITADGGEERVFFHYSDLKRRIDQPSVGQRVQFEVITSPKGTDRDQYREKCGHEPRT